MRKTAIAFALVFSNVVFPVSASAQVEWSTASGGNGHVYDFVLAENVSWGDARSAASNLTYDGMNGYLATFTTRAEQEFVISALGGGFALNQLWLGAYQDTSANDYAENYGGWRWITGEAWIGVAPNDPSKPRADYGFNNTYFDGSPEGYTITWWNTGGINDYVGTPNPQFGDGNGGSSRGYLVEFSADQAPAVPEPSTWAMMLVGFGFVGFSMRRAGKANSLRQVA